MSKLAALLTLVASFPAHADVVEPTQGQDADPAVEPAPPVRGPSMVQPTRVPDTTIDDSTPELSGGRLVGEMLLGGVFAVGGGVGGAYVGYAVETSRGCHSEFCGLGGVVLGGIGGVTLAAPVGVYFVGNNAGQTGSFGATLGGSVIGSLVGIAGAAASQSWPGTSLLVIGPLVGSIIGFNATRKWDDSHRKRRQWAPVASVANGHSSFGVMGSF